MGYAADYGFAREPRYVNEEVFLSDFIDKGKF